MVASWWEVSVRVRKGGFMVDLLLRLNIGPDVVSETWEYMGGIYPRTRLHILEYTEQQPSEHCLEMPEMFIHCQRFHFP